MRKRQIIGILLVSMLLLLGACAPAPAPTLAPQETPAVTPTPAPTPPATSVPQPPVGFSIYNDVVSNFAIPYPEDWEMIPKERIEFALVGFWDRQQSASVNSFYVMKANLPYEMDVEDYFESEKAYFPGEYANYTSVSTSTLTLNGKKAIKHTWSFTLGGDTLKYIRLYVIDEKVIWLLEAGCSMESFDSYKNTYDTMMSGFYIY